MALTDIVVRFECDTAEAVAALEKVIAVVAAGTIKPEDVDVQDIVDRIVVMSLGSDVDEGSQADSEQPPTATREVGRVVIVGSFGEDAEDYLSDRLLNAGVWHISWVDDDVQAASRARELLGSVVLAVVADEDVAGEFVTHVRENGKRMRLERWIASVNPGRHAGSEDDE